MSFKNHKNRTKSSIYYLIHVFWVIFLLSIFGIGYVGYQIVKEVEDEGLKGVIEQLWYGKTGETK